MPPDEFDIWTQSRERIPVLMDSDRKTHKQVEELRRACAEGNAEAARQAIDRLQSEVAVLVESARAVGDALPSSPTAGEFSAAIESLAASRGDINPVVRAGNRILLGATVVRVNQSTQGVTSATVGSRHLNTSSAVTVVDEALRQAKEKFDHKKALKSLKDAFSLHVALQGADPDSAIVSLEEVRKMIGITRDGSGYSHEDMTRDIQMLSGAFHKELSDAGVIFVPVPAARVQFELMLESGNLANLASMQLTKTERTTS